MLVSIDSSFSNKYLLKKAKMFGCANPVHLNVASQCSSCKDQTECRLFNKIFTITRSNGRFYLGDSYLTESYPLEEGDIINIVESRFIRHKKILEKHKEPDNDNKD